MTAALPFRQIDAETIELLDAIAGTVPKLSGCACRKPENRKAFDLAIERVPGSAAARRRAIGICAGCPALAQCAAWLDSLDERATPFGVTAGRVVATRTDRAFTMRVRR